VRVAQGADVLVCDAQYTPSEFEQRRGWGHGTWLDSVKMAQRAGVGKLVLTHHDPDHDDDFLDGVLACARQEFACTFSAAEGLVLSLP
jgi:ribonuclease BN (tRNA processing enzyme)